MKRSTADIVREYGPFPDVGQVGGVSYDGTNIWIAAGDTMKAVDPERGTIVRSLNVPAHAGTAFDGKYLFQISGDRIQKVDPELTPIQVRISSSVMLRRNSSRSTVLNSASPSNMRRSASPVACRTVTRRLNMVM